MALPPRRANFATVVLAPRPRAYAGSDDGESGPPPLISPMSAFTTAAQLYAELESMHTSSTTASSPSFTQSIATNGRRLDIQKMIAQLADSQEIPVESVEQDGRKQCEALLLERGVKQEDLEKHMQEIKQTLVEKHAELCTVEDKLKEAQASSTVIKSWLQDYERTVMPRLSENAEFVEKISDLHTAINAVIDKHNELNCIDALKEEHAKALGALRHVVQTAVVCPSVCVGMQCCLCMDKTCDRALVPCGHMLCHACADKSFSVRHMSKCHVCRTGVVQVLRLYQS